MLKLKPITLKESNEFVYKFHRHHGSVVGHKFSIGAELDGKLIGVVIAGRPVSRYLDDGYTIEITRLCTDGTKNACSFLYSAASRAAKAMGYKKIITYILESETGSSLIASGFECKGKAGGLTWTGKRKHNDQSYPMEYKKRYEKILNQ